MKYSLTALQADVMARLGEIARPQGALESGYVPWPEDIVALKVRSLLGEVGSRVISGCEVVELSDCEVVGLSGCEFVGMREMPCGLFAGEMRLPEGFLRLASAKMAGWRRSVGELIMPDSAEWGRQWSAEPGIAGCPERPRAYLDRDVEGLVLRLMGSRSADGKSEWVGVVCVPAADENGEFEFPERLYHRLVGSIVSEIKN